MNALKSLVTSSSRPSLTAYRRCAADGRLRPSPSLTRSIHQHQQMHRRHRPSASIHSSKSITGTADGSCSFRMFSVNAVESDAEDADGNNVSREVEEANIRCQGSLYVQKKTTQWGGWGVHASRPFPKGSIVLSSSLLQSNDTSCSHSIQIDWNQHIMMDLPARFLNHSCDANVGVMMVANEGGSYDFVALREIESGDEIRFDYETTEFEVGAFSDCHCGATTCRGNIRGFKYNSSVVREKYGDTHISGYLLNE
ncbi:predicted protein [Thalassiosira pseudonana CCMP1335]|uniref:Post-SET domain-containing protein n=1 Tax=Thalassiosira pseudonana TaxID=35128 RepID=B8LEK5_THAPS|nr:predicted protein [Thalassiosira pseudonana CCMP1335]EED86239.1 predicted protein [Thalassiosira pseudonana CCMP1335]